MLSTTHLPTPKCHLSLPTSILIQPLFASRQSQVILVFSQMNETPSARMRVNITLFGNDPFVSNLCILAPLIITQFNVFGLIISLFHVTHLTSIPFAGIEPSGSADIISLFGL